MEERSGIYQSQVYDDFANRARKARLDLMRLVLDVKARDESLVGVGCPGRSSTLINYVGLDPDLMPYIAEQSTSLKLGLFLPGRHIPIVDEQRMFDEQPDYVVMLSWHYAAPIIKKLRQRGLRSKIVLPMPHVHIHES
jgi:hypothetical protein